MNPSNVTHTNLELMLFKEEILKSVRQSENKILTQFKNDKDFILSELNDCISNINNLKKETKDINDILIVNKTQLEKINEFQVFRTRTDNTMVSNNIKITNILKEIGDMKTKYDKSISENLLVPGHVGPTCKFKTLGEYIKFTITDISQMKYENEDMKVELSELKKKSENLLNNVLNLVDKGIERCNDYTDKKQKDIDKFLNMKLKEIDDKSANIREQWEKANNSIQENYTELKKNMESLSKFKNEMIEIMEQNNINLETEISKTHQKLNSNENKNENKFNGLLENYSKIQKDVKSIKEDIIYIQLNRNLKRRRSSVYKNNNIFNSNNNNLNKNDNQIIYGLPNTINYNLNKNDKDSLNNILKKMQLKNSLLYSNTLLGNLEIFDRNNENDISKKLKEKNENNETAINKDSIEEENESQQYLDNDKIYIKTKFKRNKNKSENKKISSNKHYNTNDNSTTNHFYKTYCTESKTRIFNKNNYTPITDNNKYEPGINRKNLNNTDNINNYPFTIRHKEKSNTCNDVDLLKLANIKNRVNNNNMLIGKKIKQKKNNDIDNLNESFSLDNLYKNYFTKKMKIKNDMLKSQLLPQKLVPAFGTTVYQFYRNDLKKENSSISSNNNINNTNQNYSKRGLSSKQEKDISNVVNTKLKIKK